ncbi:SDR family NAD(P)-dependent oxidoreductase [Actinomadura rayongensis]|uniref:SDR family NAD(P)-dependent oxidoreductase n=1 Tax=Actinomadura rayongensis TaxID=1429076 RepID=A0A6I4W0Y3_9ACTN|nr:SDR family NAD(P)-dependent oxidoreductase [Actinomadura rayongensis]MXQ63111.1 SDR family NAD(P)-dependent oxidoreductase [Actinomadura rayongensis]
MGNRVWLITGASSGFGRAIARAAQAAGDTVVGAVRDPAALDDLETVRLDVTDPAAVEAAVAEVVARHGRIDVLVNNAGRSQIGAVEETTDAELRALMELHFFGPAALVRAVLPHMRARGSGAIVQMSSMGGQLSFAGFGAYSATKCALEGFSEALAEEVAPHGIKVLIVEPGAFRTALFGGRLYLSEPMPEYADTVGKTREMAATSDGTQPGDPAKAAAAILTALDGDTPLRLPLGDDAVDALVAHADAVRAELRAWEPVARATAFD